MVQISGNLSVLLVLGIGGVFPSISHLSAVYGIWMPYVQDEWNAIINRQLVLLTVSHKPEARSTRVIVRAKIVSEDNPSLEIEKNGAWKALDIEENCNLSKF